MQSELQALLEAARDEPTDDAPRLVLADWLEEHGRGAAERERGELIRLQCRLSRMAPGDPERPALEAREQEVLRTRLPAWLEGLAAPLKDARTDGRGCTVERGLLRPWFASGARWLAEGAPDGPPWAWVDGLVLLDLRVREVEQLAGSRVLGRLNHLSLGPDGWSGWSGDQAVGAAGVRALASCRHLARLTHLDLHDCLIGPAGARALAESPFLRRLRHLDLGGWDCTPANLIRDEGARALAGSPCLAGLVSLDLTENVITAEGARAIAESPHLGGLRRLDLRGNPVGPEGATALASSASLSRLTFVGLDLTTSEFHSAGVRAEGRKLEEARDLLRRRFGAAWCSGQG